MPVWNGFRLILIAAFAILITACSDNDSDPEIAEETGVRFMESRTSDATPGDNNPVARTFYLQLPSDYDPRSDDENRPLVIAYHGTGGSYERWLGDEPRYDLLRYIGDDAIVVLPNALPQVGMPVDDDGDFTDTSLRQWNFEYDFLFFEDLLAELDRINVRYDPDRVFVTGHSSGGGMTHEVGCRFGDVVRAIAPSAGSLISGSCVGSVAVIQSQGTKDILVPQPIAEYAQNFWVLYNGLDPDLSVPAEIEPCVDFSLLPLGSADYPMQWCLHDEGSNEDFSGHAWASFTGEAFWNFFTGLPLIEAPTPDAPPGGGNDNVLAAADTTLSFTLSYPNDIRTPIAGAISLFEPDIPDGAFAAPSVFLNVAWNPGPVAPGSTVTYENVPITFFVFSGDIEFPSDWKLQISVYVEGGSRPVPTPGVDHQVRLPITFEDRTTPVILNNGQPLDVVPAPEFTF